MPKSERQGSLTDEQFDRLQHLMTRYGKKNWEIAGWRVEGEPDLKSALYHEFGYRESLIYLLRFGDYDIDPYMEQAREEYPKEKNKEKLEQLAWTIRDVDVDLMLNDLYKAVDEEQVLEVACLFWDQVKITEVECAYSFCKEMVCVSNGFECPSCNDFLCEKHSPSADEPVCYACGHVLAGIDAMCQAIKDAGEKVGWADTVIVNLFGGIVSIKILNETESRRWQSKIADSVGASPLKFAKADEATAPFQISVTNGQGPNGKTLIIQLVKRPDISAERAVEIVQHALVDVFGQHAGAEAECDYFDAKEMHRRFGKAALPVDTLTITFRPGPISLTRKPEWVRDAMAVAIHKWFEASSRW